MDNTLFDNTIGLTERALDLRARRHELILSNIANADTPGYKAFDLMVEEALASETSSGQGQVQLKQTSAAHLSAPNSAGQAGGRVQQLDLSTQVTLRGDGNTVDMDREMSSLAANQLQYKAATQILYKKFQFLKNVIQGDRR